MRLPIFGWWTPATAADIRDFRCADFIRGSNSSGICGRTDALAWGDHMQRGRATPSIVAFCDHVSACVHSWIRQVRKPAAVLWAVLLACSTWTVIGRFRRPLEPVVSPRCVYPYVPESHGRMSGSPYLFQRNALHTGFCSGGEVKSGFCGHRAKTRRVLGEVLRQLLCAYGVKYTHAVRGRVSSETL